MTCLRSWSRSVVCLSLAWRFLTVEAGNTTCYLPTGKECWTHTSEKRKNRGMKIYVIRNPGEVVETGVKFPTLKAWNSGIHIYKKGTRCSTFPPYYHSSSRWRTRCLAPLNYRVTTGCRSWFAAARDWSAMSHCRVQRLILQNYGALSCSRLQYKATKYLIMVGIVDRVDHEPFIYQAKSHYLSYLSLLRTPYLFLAINQSGSPHLHRDIQPFLFIVVHWSHEKHHLTLLMSDKLLARGTHSQYIPRVPRPAWWHCPTTLSRPTSSSSFHNWLAGQYVLWALPWPVRYRRCGRFRSTIRR